MRYERRSDLFTAFLTLAAALICYKQALLNHRIRHGLSQAVVVERPAKTVYIGGQNGVDADGDVVGPTIAEQARQALGNLATILESEGASLSNIVHWTIAVADGHRLDEGFAAFQQTWNPADPPPAITVHVVSGPAPGFLVEIDAIAVV